MSHFVQDGTANLEMILFRQNHCNKMNITLKYTQKHKFFDSPADSQPSYREVSRYSTNSVLNTQQQMNKHGSGERRACCM